MTGLYQRRELLTFVCPVSHSDGHDGFGLIDEFVPGLAAGLDDGVVIFEDLDTSKNLAILGLI